MRLGDRYEVESAPIGAGGYAHVHRAIDLITRKTVAVKVPRPRRDKSADRSSRARLKREIRTLRSLNHAHILPLLAAGSDYSWYAMPLARGNLFDIGPLHGELLWHCMRQVALALAHSNAAGEVHRDLTPWNVLWLEDPPPARWVVADWGLVLRTKAVNQTPLTHDGSFIGTNGFVAPEVWTKGAVDARADIYSLGRVAGWSLTGKLPQGFDPVDVQDTPWKDFVERATASVSTDRLSSLHGVLVQLESIRREQEAASQQEPCARCGRPAAGTKCQRCGSYLIDYN